MDYTLPLDELPDPLPIMPLDRPFDVVMTPPGSKSITCRAYVLAALAEGESRIVRPLRAEDTDRLLDALCTLGAKARWVAGKGHDGEDVLITGVAGRFPRGGEVNLGDGGTPTRFMIACACLAAEPVVVDGSNRMRERPVAEGVNMLRQLGANIEYVEEEGRLPVRATPSDDFKGGEITIGKTQSSQFISAMLLIGSFLSNGLAIAFEGETTSATYVELTLSILESWDLGVQIDAPILDIERCRVEQGPVSATAFEIEIDASAAVYWLLARSIIADSWITVRTGTSSLEWDYLSQQPDARYYHDVLAVEQASTRAKQPWRDPLYLSCASHPDGAIATAVLSAAHGVYSDLSGLHTLRVKETDRIAALANELRKVGCTVETMEDSITIHPIAQSNPRAEPGANPIIIETYNDHRMAMAFAVLGLRVPGLAIRNPACVRKSYPGFWADFQKLYDNPRK